MLENLSLPAKLMMGAVGLFGMGMAGTGGIGLFCFTNILTSIMTRRMALAPDSETFSRWQDPPAEITFSVYLFNITNPEYVGNDERMQLQEIGPYAFRVRYYKNVTGWSESEGLVTYNLQTTYEFNENKSKGDMSEEIFFLNVPLVVGVTAIRDLAADDMSTIKEIVDVLKPKLDEINAELVVKKTVAELLFDGYESKTMKTFFYLAKEFGSPAPNVDPDHFALLRDKNNSVVGPFVAYTGKTSMKKFNIIKSFRNMTLMNYWNKDPYCNQINGTDGMMFPPFIDKTQKLYVFSSDLCRSVFMDYEDYEEIKGIPTYKYELSDDSFEDPRKRVANQCFCKFPKVEDVEYCPRKGMFSLKPCTGIPVFSSNPHFYHAARRHVEQVEGVLPNWKEHILFLNVNPTTGIVVKAHKTGQISINLTRLEFLPQVQNVSDAFIPLFWFKEEAELDDDSVEEFKDKVMNPVNFAKTVLITVAGIGGICFVTVMSIALYYTGKLRMKLEENNSEIVHYK